jgi:hypothetical protein
VHLLDIAGLLILQHLVRFEGRARLSLSNFAVAIASDVQPHIVFAIELE